MNIFLFKVISLVARADNILSQSSSSAATEKAAEIYEQNIILCPGIC